MKHLSLFMLLILITSFSQAQEVQVDGKLKVSQLDIVNTEDILVVKQADGTFAGRQVASLPPSPPPISDTTKTFSNDLKFAELLCNCTNVPPFLVESSLDAGYTHKQLIESGIGTNSLVKAGISVDSLLKYNKTPQDLLSAGVTPNELWSAGVPAINLYGLYFGGGLLLYIDTLDIYPNLEGIVVTSNDQPNSPWGCEGTVITGADGTMVGTGMQNSLDIVLECTFTGIAADVCLDFSSSSFTNWHLPSVDEFQLIKDNLTNHNKGNFQNTAYWTSTEWANQNDLAYLQNPYIGGQSLVGYKDNLYTIRAVRYY